MMKVEQIKSHDDIERYIEGCLNDFETAISTKDETLVYLAELVVHVYKEAEKEQCNIANVAGQSEQLPDGFVQLDSAYIEDAEDVGSYCADGRYTKVLVLIKEFDENKCITN